MNTGTAGHKTPSAGGTRHFRILVRSALIVIVLVAGLVLRVQAVQQTVVDTPVRADARDYFVYAINMKAFGVYSRSDSGFKEDPVMPEPDNFRPPMYPIMLAKLIDLPLQGDYLKPVLQAQIVLGMATVGLTLIAGCLLFRFPVAIAAGALTAISPHLVSLETYLLTETLFAMLLLAGLTVLVASRRTTRSRLALLLAVLAGALLAASALTRSTSLYLIPFLLAVSFCWLPSWRRSLVACLLGFLLVYGPWIARNSIYLPESSNELTKSFLQHGMYPGMMYDDRPESFGVPYRFDPDAERSRVSVQSVIAEIGNRFREEPLRHLAWYVFGKPAMFWQWGIVAGQGGIFVYPVVHSPYLVEGLHSTSSAVMRVLHVPLVLVAALGALVMIARSLRGARSMTAREQDFLLIALVLAYATLIHVIGAPFPRYSIPFRPELYLMAVGTLALFWQHLSRMRLSRLDARDSRPVTQ